MQKAITGSDLPSLHPESKAGQQVNAVVNFHPKNIAGFLGQCLVLGFYDEENTVVLLAPKSPVLNGAKIG